MAIRNLDNIWTVFFDTHATVFPVANVPERVCINQPVRLAVATFAKLYGAWRFSKCSDCGDVYCSAYETDKRPDFTGNVRYIARGEIHAAIVGIGGPQKQ